MPRIEIIKMFLFLDKCSIHVNRLRYLCIEIFNVFSKREPPVDLDVFKVICSTIGPTNNVWFEHSQVSDFGFWILDFSAR